MKTGEQRFKGIYEISEWDDTVHMVSVVEEYAELADYFKHNTSYWYYITYKDGLTHKLSEQEWKDLKPSLCSSGWLAHCVKTNIRY
jgi:hypothetical protein